MSAAIKQVYELNSIKSASKYPKVLRAVQHHQLMSQYGSALTPEIIDKMPFYDVQLLRLCIQEESKAAKQGQKKQQFYAEAGVQQAGMARF